MTTPLVTFAKSTCPNSLVSLSCQYSYAFMTSATNCLGQTAHSQFDFYTSRLVDAEDANGLVSSGYSENDPLDRPTKVGGPFAVDGPTSARSNMARQFVGSFELKIVDYIHIPIGLFVVFIGLIKRELRAMASGRVWGRRRGSSIAFRPSFSLKTLSPSN